jgi:copper chaperone CopZ
MKGITTIYGPGTCVGELEGTERVVVQVSKKRVKVPESGEEAINDKIREAMQKRGPTITIEIRKEDVTEWNE